MDKSDSELKIEAVTLALIVLAAALFLLIGRLFDPLSLLIVGVVLVGSAVYQTQRGWHVSLVTWVLGGLLTLGGLGLKIFLVAVLQVNWLAIGLVAVAGWMLYRVFVKR